MKEICRSARVFSKVKVTDAANLLLLLLVVSMGSLKVIGQQVESSLPLSQRMTIDLAAGVPEYIADATSTSNTPQSNWWFENAANESAYSTESFDERSDSKWQQVGLPYDANIPRTFINQTSGGGQGSLTGNDNWYRLHFKIDPKLATRKFMLEIEGSHTGLQVYVNGTLLPGISAVAADARATHVIGFVPVAVDLTPYLHADGTTDNVIAIDVSRGSTWFEQPNFSGAFRFGQAMAGLFRNVKMFVTNQVHIPINVYSNQKTWGTYVGTVSIVPAADATATAASAIVEVQTNVLNESATTQQVTLTTQIVDANGDVVVTAPPITQSVAPMTAGSFPSTAQAMFQQQITVPNPKLWYPNNSTFGKPYMYKVYHIVSVNGTVVDSAQSPLGIRTIKWDTNLPYFNGHATYLWGASGRYDYPALGSSVPDEQVWRDIAQFAASGGNIWRPGHSTSSEEFVEAADAYGVMIDQPSGDGEGSFTNPSADDTTLKTEIHRDMIIRDRSHPSILDWEEDNGGNNISLVNALSMLEAEWDNINPRQQATRAYQPAYSEFVGLQECDGAGCESGIKNSNPTKPAFGAEYWDNVGTGRGLAYDNELAFAAPYLNDWRQGRVNKAFGMAQWYFADTPGEVSSWSEYQNIVDNRIDPTTGQKVDRSNYVRSLGYSMVDQNRFPKLLYYIYQANWVPFSIKPVVALAHHWNRGYEYKQGTPIQENAFSNCPAVRLLINGVNKDPLTGATLEDQTPNPWTVQSQNDLTQNTTVMPGQVHWMVNWAAGTVAAECIDDSGNVVTSAIDSRTTAGAENKIVLKAISGLVKPDGTSFQWTSNGSDAAFVVAEVEDAQGNIVPTAADNVTFSVTGPATYMGGTEQVVASPLFTNYYQDAFSEAHSNVINGVPYAFFHSPGDPELNVEGGLTKIALRSTFAPGTVTVTATAPGLQSGSVQLSSVAPAPPVQSQPPAIIVPPVSQSVTAGYPATFSVAASGSGSLNYQWYAGNNAITGATSTSYTTPATTTANNNETFMVTVTSASGFGAVTSNPVTLSVVAAANAAITTQPASQSAVVGQTTTLTVVASGSPTLNYAWYEDNTQVANGPQNSFTTPVLTTAGTHTFYVIVSNPLNKVQSANAVLTVNAAVPVSFLTQPASQIAAANQPVKLMATVAGSAPYTYQWQFTPQGGQTTILEGNTQLSNTISYVIPAMSSANVGTYTVTVNNAANVPVTSAAAKITLAPPGNNLALGRPATSSSTQNACNDATTAPPYTGVNCLGAGNAVDGNLTSRWGSATAGAPPTTPVAGVDPSWLQVDLGSVQPFNTIIITWEAAYAAQYQIQYTNADPATNPVWNVATTNNSGAGGTETLTFPTVQARYVRMLGKVRGGNYGYSMYEFQVYNIPQLGATTERYSVSASNPSLIVDNLLGLTWTSTVKTNPAVGSQFTGVDAAAYCSSIGMRLPTQAEALDISGINNSSKAFPGAWNTWTSTLDPNNASQTAIVGFDGSVEEKVTNNWPGETLCTTGTSTAQAAAIQTQPSAANAAIGQSAMFTVAATGKPAPSYQWSENGNVIPGATSATYITQPVATTDSGSTFSVVVQNGERTNTSTPVKLTVGGSTGGGATAPVITTQPSSQTVTVGTAATFRVVATGNGTLSYQWRKNNVAIAGATAIAYTTAATVAADNGAQFSVVVSANGLSTTSSTAVLTVNASGNTGGGSGDIVAIDAGSPAAVGSFAADVMCSKGGEFDPGQPITIPSGIASIAAPEKVYESACQGNQTFTIGGLISGNSYTVVLHFAELYFTTAGAREFNVAINGAPVAGLQNFDIFAAAGNARFTAVVKSIANVKAVNGQIVVAFTRGAVDQPMFNGVQVLGTVATPPPAPTAPTITTQPKSVTVSAGTSATFLVMAGGTGPFTYQWMKGGISISGATVASYTTPLTSTADNGSSFTVIVKNSGGSTSSNAAVLTVTTATAPTITLSPVGQTVTIGRTASFTAAATGVGTLTYQWSKNGTPIAGATTATYTTPGTTAADNGASFTVVASSGGVTSAPSTKAVLTVSSTNPSSITYPGVIGTDLNNNTNGAYTDSEIYVEVLGNNPANGNALSWVGADGTVHAASVADDTAANHLTGPDGKSYPAYSFTLAQSKLLKLPALSSGRVYISLGGPMYMPIMPAPAGSPLGYAGPNPQNATDPNIKTHYDWYEFTTGLHSDGTPNIFVNTTQVDQFGLPLLLDVWDASPEINVAGVVTNHGQTGITESVAAIDAEYAAQTPAAFHLNPVSNLRILAPAKDTFAAGKANDTYFDSYINSVWSYFTTNSLSVSLNNGSREFVGNTNTTEFQFTEKNLSNGAYVGGNYIIGKPTTPEIFACNGVFNNDGNNGNGGPQAGGTLAIEVQLCAAFNRHVVESPAQWTVPEDFYLAAPANYYAQFWHNHSVEGLAYGFPYDDASGFSSTIQSSHTQHMAFGIGW